MMCPGVFLTVELAAHPTVLAIVRTTALAIAKSLESIFISVIERAAKRHTVDNRTHLLRRCSVTGRLMLATRPVLTGSVPVVKMIGIVAVATLAASVGRRDGDPEDGRGQRGRAQTSTASSPLVGG
jgi:hypothetical protein